MKKVISVILSIIACFIMVACDDSREPSEPILPNGGTEQGGNESQEPEKPSGGGNVVTPIQPGGNYNGGEY